MSYLSQSGPQNCSSSLGQWAVEDAGALLSCLKLVRRLQGISRAWSVGGRGSCPQPSSRVISSNDATRMIITSWALCFKAQAALFSLLVSLPSCLWPDSSAAGPDGVLSNNRCTNMLYLHQAGLGPA